jgi:hypothetical protein
MVKEREGMKNKYFALIAIALVLMLVTLSGCHFTYLLGKRQMRGNGSVTEHAEDIDGRKAYAYTLIVTDLNFDPGRAGTLTVNETDGNDLVVKTDKNILDTLTVSVDENTATITVAGDSRFRYDPSEFSITVGAALVKANIDGMFTLDIRQQTIPELYMTVNGACDGDLRLGDNLQDLDMKINGATDLNLYGAAERFKLHINGAASIEAYELEAMQADVTINGAGSCKVYASQSLKAHINGAGELLYDGNPATVDQSISGVGVIRAK